MTAKALMFQGTGSDVGKSLIVAGLARALTNRGHSVRPFKPQNMSNNGAATEDGGEIGRAQALQARAARIAPSVHMNPVLLKPQSGLGAQIIVQGKLRATTSAAQYQQVKKSLLPSVLNSFSMLHQAADFVLVEGAGSASEINLRANDIANMGFARAANVPVVLIGDIDRGGVIASLVGTQNVIDPADAAMIKGFIVNRFRGDKTLFDEGMAEIARRTGWEGFGLVPHLPQAARLPAEDALGLTGKDAPRSKNGNLRIAAVMLPHIANFDDLDPLEAEPDVELIRIWPGSAIPGDIALVILPDSSSPLAGLAALREAGFDIDIQAHIRRGGHVFGLGSFCQMVDQLIAPLKVENINTCSDGQMAEGIRVFGTKLQGFFADDARRAKWLEWLGGAASELNYEAGVEDALDTLAVHLEAHLDIDALISHAA